jgi:hypothetical protein
MSPDYMEDASIAVYEDSMDTSLAPVTPLLDKGLERTVPEVSNAD